MSGSRRVRLQQVDEQRAGRRDALVGAEQPLRRPARHAHRHRQRLRGKRQRRPPRPAGRVRHGRRGRRVLGTDRPGLQLRGADGARRARGRAQHRDTGGVRRSHPVARVAARLDRLEGGRREDGVEDVGGGDPARLLDVLREVSGRARRRRRRRRPIGRLLDGRRVGRAEDELRRLVVLAGDRERDVPVALDLDGEDAQLTQRIVALLREVLQPDSRLARQAERHAHAVPRLHLRHHQLTFVYATTITTMKSHHARQTDTAAQCRHARTYESSDPSVIVNSDGQFCCEEMQQ